MRKSLLYLFVAIFAACTFVSCSSDDDDSNGSQIVGKWQLVSVLPQSMAEDYDDCEFEGYVEFEVSGRYSDHRPCGVNDIGGGKWDLSGNTLTITSDIFPTPMEATVEISNSTLVIIQDAYDFDDDYNVAPVVLKETYKRVE